jgi:hypothetical protein
MSSRTWYEQGLQSPTTAAAFMASKRCSPRAPAPAAGVLVTSSIEEACVGADVAIMLAGAPRRPGADRREIVASNVSIYKEQAAALESRAAPNVKVRPAGAPASASLRLASVACAGKLACCPAQQS